MPQNWLDVSWKALALRAVVGVVLGVVAIAWPQATVLAFVVLWGVWALVDGAGALAVVFAKGVPGGTRALAGVLAALSLAAAAIAILRPGVTAVAITWVLGVWLLVRGLLEVVAAVRAPGAGAKALIAVTGVLDIVLGVLFMANPGRAALGVAVVLGVLAVVWGVVLLVAAFALRSQSHDLAAGQAPEFPTSPAQG
ncbi:MAG: HdeD family acid-resistance protein [Nocardioides sp.]|uniref:HdeD family acid-resistance protein n=1 Tax=Nocardioides sp. TaxID=35761 RepID=UPI003F048F9C